MNMANERRPLQRVEVEENTDDEVDSSTFINIDVSPDLRIGVFPYIFGGFLTRRCGVFPQSTHEDKKKTGKRKKGGDEDDGKPKRAKKAKDS